MSKNGVFFGLSFPAFWLNISLFHMKITASVTKSSHQDSGPCYLHLPTFFLYIHTPVLLQNKKFLCRPSQIACTVTTINVTCTQATLRVHENPCTVIDSSMLKLFEFANLSFFFLSTVHWCYQLITIENYFSPVHIDHYDLRK